MSRITYSATTIGGKMTAVGLSGLHTAQDNINRAVALANSISSGGASPALLDNSVEFGVATGQGAAFYTALNNMKSNLATITAAVVADLDMGG